VRRKRGENLNCSTDVGLWLQQKSLEEIIAERQRIAEEKGEVRRKCDVKGNRSGMMAFNMQ
jgi:hypothetical protein